MDKLNKANLQQLLEVNERPAVTIYIPMHTTASPPHVSENQIRFKNLMHEAAEEVRKQDIHSDLAAILDQKVDELHNDLEFWENQTPGLLICATPSQLSMYHIPIDTEEYVAVDEKFHLAPLIGLIQDEKEFYLLALAQHNPKLCKGDLYGLEPAEVELPSSVRQALNIDEANRKSENQGTANAPSSNTSWFNGRGGARNPQEEDRLRFFRMVDKTIYDKADRSLPLLIAGTESEIAEYRSISKYPHLLNAAIHGNHTEDNNRSLFESAQSIVWQELVAPDHMAAVEEYRRLSGANPARIAKDTAAIVQAAVQGRVDKLLARMSRQTSDTVRDQAEDVPRLTFPDKEASKQLNDVALTVWQNSGRVYNLIPEEMPDGKLMAARLRY